MARIAGVDLPNDRKILYALTVIYGIGPTLAKKVSTVAKITTEKRVKDLSEEEISRIQKAIEEYSVEGDLRRSVAADIRRLEEINSYRGIRHRRGLPVRGQRTRSNARAKRGKRQTIGAMKKELRATTAQKTTQDETKEKEK
jgi:small subunit ribosomal protein S13